MFRTSSAHLQEDTVVHVQHMVVTLYESSWWLVGTQLEGGLSQSSLKLCTYKPPGTESVLTQAVYRQATKNSHRE